MSNRRRPAGRTAHVTVGARTPAESHTDALLDAAMAGDPHAVQRAVLACLRDDPGATRSAVGMLAWMAAAFAGRLPDKGARVRSELASARLAVAAHEAGVTLQ